MKQKSKGGRESARSRATLGFEQTLWQAADKLRNNKDAAEYKHVVLGLISLKYISDAFEERHGELIDLLLSGGLSVSAADRLVEAIA